MIDVILFAGLVIAIILFLAYCISAVKLLKSKKNSKTVEGITSNCVLVKKWSTTGYDLNYTYTVDGKVYRSSASVKGVIPPKLRDNQKMNVYYNPENPSQSFLEEEFTIVWKSLLVLLLLIVAAGLSYLFG